MKKLLWLLLAYSANALPTSRQDVDNAITSNNSSAKEIFNLIYQTNYWYCGESVSGEGSTMYSTETIRQILPYIIEKLSIKTMLDAPCGDYHWMKTVNLSIEQYIGVDIVPELIENNKKQYGTENKIFECCDLIEDSLPQVDLILCRDCLAHLSFFDAQKVINNFKKSGSKYLLATTNPATRHNKDIRTGQTWAYNLRLKPFLFPKPLLIIEENSAEPASKEFRKSLGLWVIEELP